VLTNKQAALSRYLPGLILLAASVFGGIKIAVGLSRHRPVGFLVVLCALSLVVAFAFFVRLSADPAGRPRLEDAAAAQRRPAAGRVLRRRRQWLL
jgi:uncharacterized protein (TIGR04222 family)